MQEGSNDREVGQTGLVSILNGPSVQYNGITMRHIHIYVSNYYKVGANIGKYQARYELI